MNKSCGKADAGPEKQSLQTGRANAGTEEQIPADIQAGPIPVRKKMDRRARDIPVLKKQVREPARDKAKETGFLERRQRWVFMIRA